MTRNWPAALLDNQTVIIVYRVSVTNKCNNNIIVNIDENDDKNWSELRYLFAVYNI